MDSILTSIKKMLGIEEEYTQFDVDITIHINSVIAALTQIGVGPTEGFVVIDKLQTWTDWLAGKNELASVKTYVYLRVRLIFDPPANSAVTKSYEELIKETEFRILVTTDPALVIEPIVEEEYL